MSAMDTAMQFFDELKEKYMHQVEQVIEDWDYQDFSPDKRCALLDGEVVMHDGDDDHHAMEPSPPKPTINWVGLSPDAELEDFDYGAVLKTDSSKLGYESKMVIMSTPAGGIQGLPDPDVIQRFLLKAVGMDAMKVADAFYHRLQQKNWQIRCKALVIMQMLLESKHVGMKYLQAFHTHPQLAQCIDAIRCHDHNHVAREQARKCLSLLRSNGTNAMLVQREYVPPKPHVRHAQVPHAPKKHVVAKKTIGSTPLSVKTSMMQSTKEVKRIISPRVAQAAMASWKRRSMAVNGTAEASNLMPFQQPSTYSSTISTSTTSSASSSRYGSGNLSGFSFVMPPAAPVSSGYYG